MPIDAVLPREDLPDEVESAGGRAAHPASVPLIYRER
jgi:hypothetical protein